MPGKNRILVEEDANLRSDGDPIFCSHDDAPVDRAALALKMHNASEMCVQFCDEFRVLNDLYLWLLYENVVAYCSMRSKGSKSTPHMSTRYQEQLCTWRTVGE